MLLENINNRLDNQATLVKLVFEEDFQAVRTAQVVYIAQTGGLIQMIFQRAQLIVAQVVG